MAILSKNSSFKMFFALVHLVFSVICMTVFTDDLFASEFSFFSLIVEHVRIPEHTLALGFVAIIIIVLSALYRIKLSSVKNKVIPDQGLTLRNTIEVFGEFLYEKCVSIIGEKDGPKHFPFVLAIFMIILFSNLLGLIPGFLPPTSNFNTTFALGLLSFCYYTFYGMKTHGVINYFKHFMGPLWYMAVLLFPIELVSDVIRPLTLGVRLYGNLFGDHLVLGLFTQLVPLVVPVIFLFFGLLVSFVQTFVFCVLTMVYISLAVSSHHEEEDSNHAHEN
ncbi:MAG: F0F1 ATP synthase subunit A [Oligoflexia bacterium]|nr:F0F1 ATP synthase subunit A [Oligoflexia bacterium]